MTTKPAHDSPILVTGAAGDVGAIGRNLTASRLLAQGRSGGKTGGPNPALRGIGAEVVQGDLYAPHLDAPRNAGRAVGMSVLPAYLEATVNTAAVARHHGVEAFVNMSQMTVAQMSITETTDSPQHKLHWLAEVALSWSGTLQLSPGAADGFPRGLLLALGLLAFGKRMSWHCRWAAARPRLSRLSMRRVPYP